MVRQLREDLGSTNRLSRDPLERCSDPQGSGSQIDVSPVQAQRFALAKAEGHRHLVERFATVTLHGVEELSRFVGIERPNFAVWHLGLIGERRDIS